MTHTFKIFILVACCIVISMVPAAADPLSDYFNTPTASTSDPQILTYTGDGQSFTDGNLQFTFTGLTITPVCMLGTTQVSCQAGSYNPVSATSLNVAGTSTLNGYDGFDLQGQVSVSSYTIDGQQVNVTEDMNLNYTVTTIGGAASISDAHLDVAGCALDTGIQSTCLSSGTGLPPDMTVNENFSGTNQTISASAPPNILNAMADFSSPLSSIQVSKDIFLESGACAGCSVSFSDLKQYYSQVPEPGRTHGSWAWACSVLFNFAAASQPTNNSP